MTEIKIDNRGDYEIVAAAGAIRGHARKLVVLGCYLPPGYSQQEAKECLDCIENALIKIKTVYRDPYIIVGGDYNQWEIEGALAEFTDMKEVEVGPTRGSRSIDRLSLIHI